MRSNSHLPHPSLPSDGHIISSPTVPANNPNNNNNNNNNNTASKGKASFIFSTKAVAGPLTLSRLTVNASHQLSLQSDVEVVQSLFKTFCTIFSPEAKYECLTRYGDEIKFLLVLHPRLSSFKGRSRHSLRHPANSLGAKKFYTFRSELLRMLEEKETAFAQADQLYRQRIGHSSNNADSISLATTMLNASAVDGRKTTGTSILTNNNSLASGVGGALGNGKRRGKRLKGTSTWSSSGYRDDDDDSDDSFNQTETISFSRENLDISLNSARHNVLSANMCITPSRLVPATPVDYEAFIQCLGHLWNDYCFNISTHLLDHILIQGCYPGNPNSGKPIPATSSPRSLGTSAPSMPHSTLIDNSMTQDSMSIGQESSNGRYNRSYAPNGGVFPVSDIPLAESTRSMVSLGAARTAILYGSQPNQALSSNADGGRNVKDFSSNAFLNVLKKGQMDIDFQNPRNRYIYILHGGRRPILQQPLKPIRAQAPDRRWSREVTILPDAIVTGDVSITSSSSGGGAPSLTHSSSRTGGGPTFQEIDSREAPHSSSRQQKQETEEEILQKIMSFEDERWEKIAAYYDLLLHYTAFPPNTARKLSPGQTRDGGAQAKASILHRSAKLLSTNALLNDVIYRYWCRMTVPSVMQEAFENGSYHDGSGHPLDSSSGDTTKGAGKRVDKTDGRRSPGQASTDTNKRNKSANSKRPKKGSAISTPEPDKNLKHTSSKANLNSTESRRSPEPSVGSQASPGSEKRNSPQSSADPSRGGARSRKNQPENPETLMSPLQYIYLYTRIASVLLPSAPRLGKGEKDEVGEGMAAFLHHGGVNVMGPNTQLSAAAAMLDGVGSTFNPYSLNMEIIEAAQQDLLLDSQFFPPGWEEEMERNEKKKTPTSGPFPNDNEKNPLLPRRQSAASGAEKNRSVPPIYLFGKPPRIVNPSNLKGRLHSQRSFKGGAHAKNEADAGTDNANSNNRRPPKVDVIPTVTLFSSEDEDDEDETFTARSQNALVSKEALSSATSWDATRLPSLTYPQFWRFMLELCDNWCSSAGHPIEYSAFLLELYCEIFGHDWDAEDENLINAFRSSVSTKTRSKTSEGSIDMKEQKRDMEARRVTGIKRLLSDFQQLLRDIEIENGLASPLVLKDALRRSHSDLGPDIATQLGLDESEEDDMFMYGTECDDMLRYFDDLIQMLEEDSKFFSATERQQRIEAIMSERARIFEEIGVERKRQLFDAMPSQLARLEWRRRYDPDKDRIDPITGEIDPGYLDELTSWTSFSIHTHYSYDEAGNIIRKHPNSNDSSGEFLEESRMSLDSNGNPVRRVRVLLDEKGRPLRKTRYTFDANGKVVRRLRDLDATSSDDSNSDDNEATPTHRQRKRFRIRRVGPRKERRRFKGRNPNYYYYGTDAESEEESENDSYDSSYDSSDGSEGGEHHRRPGSGRGRRGKKRDGQETSGTGEDDLKEGGASGKRKGRKSKGQDGDDDDIMSESFTDDEGVHHAKNSKKARTRKENMLLKRDILASMKKRRRLARLGKVDNAPLTDEQRARLLRKRDYLIKKLNELGFEIKEGMFENPRDAKILWELMNIIEKRQRKFRAMKVLQKKERAEQRRQRKEQGLGSEDGSSSSSSDSYVFSSDGEEDVNFAHGEDIFSILLNRDKEMSLEDLENDDFIKELLRQAEEEAAKNGRGGLNVDKTDVLAALRGAAHTHKQVETESMKRRRERLILEALKKLEKEKEDAEKEKEKGTFPLTEIPTEEKKPEEPLKPTIQRPLSLTKRHQELSPSLSDTTVEEEDLVLEEEESPSEGSRDIKTPFVSAPASSASPRLLSQPSPTDLEEQERLYQEFIKFIEDQEEKKRQERERQKGNWKFKLDLRFIEPQKERDYTIEQLEAFFEHLHLGPKQRALLRGRAPLASTSSLVGGILFQDRNAMKDVGLKNFEMARANHVRSVQQVQISRGMKAPLQPAPIKLFTLTTADDIASVIKENYKNYWEDKEYLEGIKGKNQMSP